MLPLRLLALILACTLAWPAAAQVRVLIGSTSRFAPDAGGQGYAYAVTRAIAQRVGYTKVFEMMPWARARMITEHENNVLLVPVVRVPSREAHFQWLVPLLEDDFVLVSQKPIEMKTAAQRNICVLRGSAAIELADRLGYRHLGLATDEEQGLHSLLAGNCDLWLVGRHPAMTLIQQVGRPVTSFYFSASLEHLTMYLAASRSFNTDEARRWQAAYETMRTDGTITALRHSYKID